MLLTAKLQTVDFQKDMNDLICQIDKYLSIKSKSKLDADRFGVDICKTSVNDNDFFLLSEYREILIKKANNSVCLVNYSLDNIISRIKQLLNRK